MEVAYSSVMCVPHLRWIVAHADREEEGAFIALQAASRYAALMLRLAKVGSDNSIHRLASLPLAWKHQLSNSR